MAVQQQSTLVTIEYEEFSLLSSPSETSKIVQKEIVNVLGQVNMNALTYSLGHIGKLIRLAYFAAKGSGYGQGMPNLKMSIYDLSVSMGKICSLSNHTVSNFRCTSQNALLELQTCYNYLLEGFEEEAVGCFVKISNEARRMVCEAKKLQKDCEDQQEKVRKIIYNLELEENERGQEVECNAAKRAKLEIVVKSDREEAERRLKLEEEARNKKEHYDNMRDQEIRKYKKDGLVQVFKKIFAGDKNPVKDRERAWKKLSLEHYEKEKQQWTKRNEKLKAESQALAEIEALSVRAGNLEKSIHCLNQVESALMQLAEIIEAAVSFWKRLEMQCENIADAKLQSSIKKQILKDSDEKLKFWYSDGFKIEGVKYCAKWVALGCVCDDYVRNIVAVQKELETYRIQNPTQEEARQKLSAMIHELIEDNSQQISIASREIQRLDEDRIETGDSDTNDST